MPASRRPSHRPPSGVCRLVAFALVAVALVGASPSLAAGTATGQVLSGATGQPIPGATVTFEGADVVLETDPGGIFQGRIAAGSYTATVARSGYELARVAVVVPEGGSETFSVVLMPGAGADAESADPAFADEITVEAAAAELASAAALLAERKGAAQISDSIGAQEIARTSGSDAAGILKRVTGISLQEDRFVYVRGLGDRYSNTTLNGSKVPSTEFEKKVVPLNLFPTSLLDRVTVAKSYTVDQPGDFAAGYVDLRTLAFPTSRKLSIGLSTGWNSVTTGEPLLAYGGGLGTFGSGGQALPAQIPAQPLFPKTPFRTDGFSSDELVAFGRQMAGTWSPRSDGDASFDRGFKLSYGDTIGRLGVVVSASWENDFDRRLESQSFYALAGGQLVPQNVYDLEYGEETVRQSVLGSLAWEISPRHSLGLRTIHTDLATAEGRLQEGYFSDSSTDIRDQRVSYQAQEVLNSQLSGDHFLPGVGASGSTLEWHAGTSRAATDENRRETIYELRNGAYRLTDFGQSGFMYFNDLEDEVIDAAADWTTFLAGDRLHGSARGGVSWSRNERSFAGRRLRFDHRATRGVDLTLSPEELFVPENIGTVFMLEEITRPTDTYEGDHEVAAAYLQGDLALGRWRLIAGLRAEDSAIEVTTLNRLTPSADPQVTTVEDAEIFPSFNLVYGLSPRTNLRLAGSQTTNRPDFRELAPFAYIHIVGGFEVFGNPELESATIRSLDARWEWFPGGAEVVAASVFYKDFEDPIEVVALAGSQKLETFQNVEAASNYGLELELRRDLGTLWAPLAPFAAMVNTTWVESKIEIDADATSLTNPERPLAGQPELIVNAALEWMPERFGSELRLLYNLVGEQVWRGGVLGTADILQEPYSSLDLVWRQPLPGRGLSLKLSAGNLLDGDREWTQGGETFRRYEPGRTYGLSLSFDAF